MNNTLTARQALFCQEYLKDLNAAQSAIRAGYSIKGAQVQGCKLLTNPKVQEFIVRAKVQRSERTKIDADWLLTRLADEAEADIADLYDANTGALKPVHMWPAIWRKGLVAGVEVDQQYAYIDGDKVPDGVVAKIKLSDRIKRLELIGKHIDVNAFKETIDHKSSDGSMTPTAIERTIVDPKAPDSDA